MNRRTFLATGAALGATLGSAQWSWAHPDTDRRLVVVVCRGGLDGLAAVPAVGDPNFANARGPAAPPSSGEGAPLPLDGDFGLHPALAPLLPLWEREQLLAVHATAIPYQDRSHFDAQDILENGTTTAFGASTGWLARALSRLGAVPPAMAVGRSIPLLLRGDGHATSVDPRRPARHDDPALDRIAEMYAADPWLGPALDAAREAQALLATHGGPPTRPGRGGAADPVDGATRVGRMAATDAGPRTVVLQLDGWDTHTNQQGTLDRQFSRLAAVLSGLSEAMEPVWDRTVVAVVTEFGRAVRGNGTGGTDHGTGGVALLAGGAVAGGRVVSDWPGLSTRDLLDSRDLRPTLDLRSVLKGVLGDHLGLTRRDLDTLVFPSSEGISAATDLIA